MEASTKETTATAPSHPGPTKQTCPRHGEYEATVIAQIPTTRRLIWSGCLDCEEEDAKEQAAKAQEIEELRRREVIKAAIRWSGVPLRFRERTLGNYRAQTKEQREVLQVVRQYVTHFEARFAAGSGLMLCGRPGTGKTHVACAVVQAVCETGRIAKYVTAIDALRDIKSTWRKGADETEQDALWRYIGPDLLVIDELGVQFGSDAERMLLFSIVNARYENVDPTMLVTNLTVAELSQCIGERVIDRMVEGGGAVLTFGWPSYRPEVEKDAALPALKPEPLDWERQQRLLTSGRIGYV